MNWENILAYIFESIGLFEKIEPPSCGWSKSLVDCHPDLQRAFLIVKTQFETQNPGYTLKLDYTYRSPTLQFTLFQKGRQKEGDNWVITDKTQVVTDLDGTLHKSAHNLYPAQALDLYVMYQGTILWPEGLNLTLYQSIGAKFQALGFTSGALWAFDWKDFPHIQLSSFK
jgi:hypothetical protein